MAGSCVPPTAVDVETRGIALGWAIAQCGERICSLPVRHLPPE
ncbi:Uncharacterised protein [Yersinia kristensenii]|nr:Uncharacterised protein [Yersinia kristensenii]